jgi:type 1 glutamine amidotransferase/nicotinamidase-related amidase
MKRLAIQTLAMFASLLLVGTAANAAAGKFEFTLRHRIPADDEGKLYRTVTRTETWDAAQTAVIVCDVWDSHHCLNAVRRVQEMAPRMNQFLITARTRGALIIHAPSDCMAFYKDHPGRRLAESAPQAPNLPADIGKWCHRIPAEERGTYPIDQSDGGEDDDPQEHQQWQDKLRGMGRNPKAPWTRQIDVLEIRDGDAISDKGAEVWNLLEQRGIRNVVLLGVHTNMCVLGRPFGLRQMAKNGKRVVLVRDLTDTMYNPQRPPQVSHFSGTDLIVEHIEKFVCPTITSDQLLGGREMRFAGDRRPHVALVISEPEYRTEHSLTEFARQQLQRDCRVSLIYGDAQDGNLLPGLEVLNSADVALISVRRRALPKAQLDLIRKFVADGKPVVGIRTASHAFDIRNAKLPSGSALWPEFDRDVLGGNYHGHHGSRGPESQAVVWVEKAAATHPILQGIPTEEFRVHSSLYKTSPLGPKATVLLMGRVGAVQPHEPVAWTNTHSGGGRVFYCALGAPGDFALPAFQRLLANGIRWAAGREAAKP